MAETFDQILNAAVDDILSNGFDSQERVDRWLRRLREAARASMASPESLEQRLRDALAAKYAKMVDGGGLLKLNPGVDRFTLEQIKPKLRAELDRRIMASAELIRLNRQQAIDKTLQRFQGWSTSIPRGGVSAESRREVKKTVRKSLAQLPFEERRVLIDQGHKLVAAISEVTAADGGAIAVEWRSHWRQAGYDYREDHKERDGQIYLIRDSWADNAGLVKKSGNPYYDEIEAFGQLPFCRCYGIFKFNLRDLPDVMLTAKGRQALGAARAQAGTGRADAVEAVTDLAALGDQAAAAFGKARLLDRMGFLTGLRRVVLAPDRDQWHAQYDDGPDVIELQAKFETHGFDEMVHILLHEAGHRGQAKAPRAFAKFRRDHMDRLSLFEAMANPAHLEDFARRGVVDGGLGPEVFAEGYARAMTGRDVPAMIAAFWREQVAAKHMLVSKQQANYIPVWANRQTRCQRCSMFLQVGAAAAGNACTAVEGAINTVGHCELFEIAHRADATDAEPRPAVGAQANALRLERLAHELAVLI